MGGLESEIDPAGLHELVAPVAGEQGVDADVLAGARRMQEPPFADIDANVVDTALAAEKDQVTRGERGTDFSIAFAPMVWGKAIYPASPCGRWWGGSTRYWRHCKP